jgi:UDPglucose 6-dehydrogenase
VYCDGPYACAEGADALVIVTEWDQFRALDLGCLKRVMSQPVLVDLRNVYPVEEMVHHGFVYVSIGRQELRSPREVDLVVSTKAIALAPLG